MPFDPNSPSDIYSGPSSAESPGGFVFGPQGWHWGQQRVKGITFFLDNTAKVTDQWGRPIPGVVDTDTNKITVFAKDAPQDPRGVMNQALVEERKKCATHAQVIAALEKEKVDWQSLQIAGFPQLPYEQLKKLKNFPTTPLRDLKRIKDRELRSAAMRARIEEDERKRRELDEDMGLEPEEDDRADSQG